MRKQRVKRQDLGVQNTRAPQVQSHSGTTNCWRLGERFWGAGLDAQPTLTLFPKQLLFAITRNKTLGQMDPLSSNHRLAFMSTGN